MKDQQQIEDTLKALRGANEKSAAGPGAQLTDELLLGRFYSRPYCRKLRSRLAAQGVSSTMHRVGPESAIYVLRKDWPKAFEELTQHNLTHEDRRPRGLGQVYDLPIVIMVVGFVMLLVSVMISFPLIGIANFVTCVLISWMWAHFRRNWVLNDGQGTQYTVREMLLVVTLVAFLIVLWRFVIQNI